MLMASVYQLLVLCKMSAEIIVSVPGVNTVLHVFMEEEKKSAISILITVVHDTLCVLEE